MVEIFRLEAGRFFMNFQPDFKAFLRLLFDDEVRYRVFGGDAVTFYGFPRYTRVLDLFSRHRHAIDVG